MRVRALILAPATGCRRVGVVVEFVAARGCIGRKHVHKGQVNARSTIGTVAKQAPAASARFPDHLSKMSAGRAKPPNERTTHTSTENSSTNRRCLGHAAPSQSRSGAKGVHRRSLGRAAALLGLEQLGPVHVLLVDLAFPSLRTHHGRRRRVKAKSARFQGKWDPNLDGIFQKRTKMANRSSHLANRRMIGCCSHRQQSTPDYRSPTHIPTLKPKVLIGKSKSETYRNRLF